MKVLPGKYLDFHNVLIQPKRSNLGSRSEVSLERTIKFLHSGYEWTGVPIMSSNMDTTGTFEMYNVLSRYKMITVFHKHYNVDDYPTNLDPNYYSLSTGISDKDWEKTQQLIEKLNPVFLTIDVANGYSSKFVEFCKKVRSTYPKLTIIGGNVATGDMCQELLLSAGVDIVKGGIGNGCFSGDTRVLMATGTYKNIKDIEPGEFVINKDGESVEVINKINKGVKNVIRVKSSNFDVWTTVTPDHKYWVADIQKNKYKWKSISDIVKQKDNFILLTPFNIKTSSEQITSSDGKYICSRVLEYNYNTDDMEVWDIEVDCPTHSFIANNSIVHNSVCSTRIKSGIGVPQLSLCITCSDVVNGLDGHLISDGGCVVPGDVAKAFGAGAHFVMLGSMLAGHDESGGELVEDNGRKYKLFYGMSSEHAQNKHNGGMASYRSSEGKVKKVPYRGPVENTILDLLGGLRSTGTYIGAHRIKDFPKCTTFLEVTQQTNPVFDHHTHDV